MADAVEGNHIPDRTLYWKKLWKDGDSITMLQMVEMCYVRMRDSAFLVRGLNDASTDTGILRKTY